MLTKSEQDKALATLMDAGGYIEEKRVESEAVDLLVNDGYAARAGSGRVVITARGKLFARSLKARREKAAAAGGEVIN